MSLFGEEQVLSRHYFFLSGGEEFLFPSFGGYLQLSSCKESDFCCLGSSMNAILTRDNLWAIDKLFQLVHQYILNGK